MINRKKILYIVGNSYIFSRKKTGGFVSSAQGVIGGFLDHGYDVDIVSDTPLPGLENNKNINYLYYKFRFLRKLFPIKSFLNYKNLISRLDDYFFKFSLKLSLTKIILKNKYEYAYLRASTTGHIAAKIIGGKIPLILEVNKPLSMTPYNKKFGLKWPSNKEEVAYNYSERTQYDKSSIITVDSELRAKWITKFVSSKYEKKILINPNAVNTKIFKPIKKIDEMKQKYSINTDSIVVGMSSSFRWYNDEKELIEIIKNCLSDNKQILFLLVIGDRFKSAEMIKLFKKLSLLKRVKILTQIPFIEMPKVLNLCDILISHFNFHNVWPHICSIKHMEYLAVGKPVVATDVGQVNFAIENGKNGILVQQSDIKSFSNAILSLAKDIELRHSMGEEGRKKATSELTWYKNIDKILRFKTNLETFGV